MIEGTDLPKPRFVEERRWGRGEKRVPVKWVPVRNLNPTKDAPQPPFDFSARVRSLCRDIANRCPALAHIDPALLLVTFTTSRNRTRFGLQARVTPMRVENGSAFTRRRGLLYRVQRYYIDGVEMRYLVTFCLPRFQDQPFEQKLITIFHELYHIGPKFDGDLRRHSGRCQYHTHSKSGYDIHMAELVQRYLAHHPDPSLFHFLHSSFKQLWIDHGGVYGVSVPQPKLIPVPLAERVK